MARRLIALLTLLALAGCRRPGQGSRPPDARADAAPKVVRAVWRELPATAEPAAALVRERTRRSTKPALLPDKAEQVIGLVARRAREGRLWVGWPHLVQRLQSEISAAGGAYLLFGTYHDAGGQMEAFRRLIGPTGLRDLSLAALEQLPADGRWQGVPLEAQRGLSAAVGRYLRGGQREDLQQVAREQRRHNYTGWKYGYLSTMLDLLVTARAQDLDLVGCDMPRALQRRLGSAATQLDRLRELHCLHTVDDALSRVKTPRRVAMAWGQAHLASEGLARFLPPAIRVVAVHAHGHRPGPAGLERELHQRLLLADPVLVELDDDASSDTARYLLLLDGPELGVRVHRARDRLDRPPPPGQRPRLRVSADRAGQLSLGGKSVALEPWKEAVLALAPGPGTYLFVGAGQTLVGSLELPDDGALSLTLELKARQVRLELQTASW